MKYFHKYLFKFMYNPNGDKNEPFANREAEMGM